MIATGSHLHRALAIAALGTLPIVSGCVAAAAIPVVAATGVLGKKAIDGNHKRSRDTRPRTAIATTPSAPPAVTVENPSRGAIVRTAEYSDGSRVEVLVPARAAQPAAAVPAAFDLPPSEAAPATALVTTAPGQAATTGSPAQRVVPVTEPVRLATAAHSVPDKPVGASLPAPTLTPAAPVGRSADYASFARFAGVAGNVPVIGTERQSAMLANPGALSANTRMCSIQPAAVMIDLDPAGSTFDPVRATHADPAFAEALGKIRGESVIVAWVSSVTADKAGLVRKALVGSGLDPAGKDELVLLRFPEERKQTRRSDLAKELCIVAIAGDERADFDELFEYLKDPAGAQGLEALIGNGWFLIPPPLTALKD